MSDRLLTNKLNKRGPIIKPCRTPTEEITVHSNCIVSESELYGMKKKVFIPYNSEFKKQVDCSVKFS